MLRRLLFPFLFLFVFNAALHAQAGFGEPLPNASVGVPYSFDFGAALSMLFGTIPLDSGVTLSFSFGATAGSNLPPGLTCAYRSLTLFLSAVRVPVVMSSR